jgi:predicted transcriptional regulator YheO
LNDDHINPILKSYIPVIEGLAKTFGSFCEFVLHDVSEKDHSIIAIENGHITGREIGAPVTDLLMDLINKNKDRKYKVNYTSKSKEGKPLKCSTILIRDEQGKIIGSLCINIDLTNARIAEQFLQEITRSEEETEESFPENVDTFLQFMINRALEQINKPVYLANKEEKIEIIKFLKENNIFNIKGAVDITAKELNVSRYTIYNYLDEVNAMAK